MCCEIERHSFINRAVFDEVSDFKYADTDVAEKRLIDLKRKPGKRKCFSSSLVPGTQKA